MAHQFKTGDVDGTATVLAQALRDGAIKKLSEAKGGKNPFITPELIAFILSLPRQVMETPPEPRRRIVLKMVDGLNGRNLVFHGPDDVVPLELAAK